MNTPIRSIRDNKFRTVLSVASLVVALATLSMRANANTFVDPANVITMSAPSEKIVGTDIETGAPRKDIVVVARVKTDPVVLTLNSGVALFKDSVYEAARRACGADDLHGQIDVGCLRNAMKDAKPQMDAIIAKARSASNG
jgi:hypothetical protein